MSDPIQTVRAREPKSLRAASVAIGVLCALGLGACTTIEGTNALVDGRTFEREVVRTTVAGIGIIDQPQKDPVMAPRAPLVVPRGDAPLPQPQPAQAAQLPADSNTVRLDTTGLTTADLQLLRDGRVVDSASLASRPLTDAEARQLAARIQAYRRAQGQTGQRSIYLPPERLFSTVSSPSTGQSQELICLAANGDLVPLNDPSCPPEIRRALGG